MRSAVAGQKNSGILDEKLTEALMDEASMMRVDGGSIDRDEVVVVFFREFWLNASRLEHVISGGSRLFYSLRRQYILRCRSCPKDDH